MDEVSTTDTVQLSRGQIRDAIGSMTPADKTRINKAARWLAKTLLDYNSYEDLIGETELRALQGRQTWFRGQPLVAFYYATMRSIADEWRKKRLNEGWFGYEALARAPGGETEAEERRLHEMKLEVLGLFDDDAVARKIVAGMMDGLRGEERRRSSGLDPISFASKQKKIDRRLRKFMESNRS